MTMQHLWPHLPAAWLVCMQAVALVFDHVLVEMEQMGSSSLLEAALPAPSEPSSAKAPETPKGSKSPRGHGTTNAALKLLDDLCMMATGDLSMHPTVFISRQDLLISISSLLKTLFVQRKHRTSHIAKQQDTSRDQNTYLHAKQHGPSSSLDVLYICGTLQVRPN